MTPRTWKLTLAALIFLAAFGVRYYQWQREGINPDEPAWQTRIENFTLAISKGEWQFTQQSLHPGVTLSWLAMLGRTTAGYAAPGVLVYPFVDPEIFWDIHFSEIFMIVLVTAACCGLIFLLLAQLVDIPAAFIGSLLVALDPFFIANSRVLQMDALLAGFIVVSFLAALIYLKNSRWRYLILSGVFAGLSLLTKINGAVILPAVELVLFLNAIKTKPLGLVAPRRLIVGILGFGLLATVVFFVLYPAMWVQPVLTIKNLIYGILNRGLVDGGESMGDTYFWGQVKDNPGPLFYPVVLFFRTTPLVIVGAILSIIALLKKTEKRKFVLCFLLFVVLILLEMTIVAKKSERYILPIFLNLDILAGVGMTWLVSGIKYRISGIFVKKYLIPNDLYIIPIVFVLGQFMLLTKPLDWQYGSYYNPLVGGGKSAVQKVTVGFGEGLVEVADYINARQAVGPKPLWVSAFYGDSIRPAVNVGDIWYPDHWNRGDRDADLVVFYVNQIQRDRSNPLWVEYKDKTPLKTVTINGVDYAYIYKGPRVYITK